MKDASALLGPARRRVAGRLWLLNIALASGVGSSYLFHVPEGLAPWVWTFALLALVSQMAVLSVVPGALLTASAHWIRSPRLLTGVQCLGWAAFLLALLIDTRLFNVFKYHWSPQVLNLLTTPGSDDSIHLGWRVWGGGTLFFAGVAMVELFLWRALVRSVREDARLAVLVWGSLRRRLRGQPAALPRRAWKWVAAHPLPAWALVLLPAVLVEKTLYAKAELERDRQVTTLSRLFPLYPRLPVEDLAHRVLGVESADRPRVELQGVELAYPLEAPSLDPEGPRPNVLIVVIDCWRADAFDAETTPALSAFASAANGGRRFDDHLSGGNSTRFGIFSLLYGLHGSYWFPVLQAQRTPVLIDSLVAAGYESRVFSSASLNFPELRDTAFAGLRGQVHDRFGDLPAWRRDELAAEACARWWRLRTKAEREDPFFAFLLLDSPHQTYSHPAEEAPFQPSSPELDYLAMSATVTPEPELVGALKNRYKNAVHHADRVTGRLLDELSRLELDEETLVVVTGDHGEEFLERGFFGHTSAFTPEQIRVPLILRGPGIAPGVEPGSTSHLDLAPTVLELLGADPAARSRWTLGENLLDPPADRRRVVAGWDVLGLWTEDFVLRIPLNRLFFDVEVYDTDWNFVPEDEAILGRERERLEELAAECNRFLR